MNLKDREIVRLAGAEKKRLRMERTARDTARALELATKEGLTAACIGIRLGRSDQWVIRALKGSHSFRNRHSQLANGLPAVGQ